MSGRVMGVFVVAFGLLGAACSDTGTPATAPPTSVPTTVASTTTALGPTTTTVPPATTTLPPSTTTTIDRVAEMEAIITDLELRRLDALYREDEAAFRELFASPGYLEESLQVLGALEFVEEPMSIELSVLDVLVDNSACIAVELFLDLTQALGPDARGTAIHVFARTESGEWGIAYVGTGWLCDGPNPLDV